MKKRVIILLVSLITIISIGVVGYSEVNNKKDNIESSTSQDNGIKKEDTTKKEQSYKKTSYDNSKQGYELNYPEMFSKVVISSEDGKTLSTQDGKAQLSFFGRKNESKETAENNYNKTLKETKDIKYSKLTGNSYVMISEYNGKIIYYVEIVGTKTISEFEAIYPVADKEKYENMCNEIAKSFKIKE